MILNLKGFTYFIRSFRLYTKIRLDHKIRSQKTDDISTFPAYKISHLFTLLNFNLKWEKWHVMVI